MARPQVECSRRPLAIVHCMLFKLKTMLWKTALQHKPQRACRMELAAEKETWWLKYFPDYYILEGFKQREGRQGRGGGWFRVFHLRTTAKLTLTFMFFKSTYFFGCTRSWLQHTGSSIFVVAHGNFSCHMWDLVPQPGMKPGCPALGARSLSPWTTKEVQRLCFLINI